MDHYDPLQMPASIEWLALDEAERLDLVREYHLLLDISLPRPQAHDAIHAIVENQLAEEVEPVLESLARLIEQGLDRHEAIHAIGSVLLGEVNDLLNLDNPSKDFDKAYSTRLNRLTAKEWLRDK